MSKVVQVGVPVVVSLIVEWLVTKVLTACHVTNVRVQEFISDLAGKLAYNYTAAQLA